MFFFNFLKFSVFSLSGITFHDLLSGNLDGFSAVKFEMKIQYLLIELAGLVCSVHDCLERSRGKSLGSVGEDISGLGEL